MVKKVHFIGIGGAGMSAIARILVAENYLVSGSDIKESSTTESLRQLGAIIYIGQKADNISADLDEVVISTAIYPDNVELVRARELGIKVLHRADKLAEIMKGMESLAVAGAHGKTTTTGMAAIAFTGMGLDPHVLVGGDMQEFYGNARIGKGNYLVTEADESDGTFLRLFPKMAIVTNVENDHLDHYGCVENILAAFKKFLQQLPKDGLAVINGDDHKLVKLAEGIDAPVYSFGLNWGADFTAKNITYDGVASHADVYFHGEEVAKLTIGVPGIHNITNALAVLAVAKHLQLDLQKTADQLAPFRGVKRRFQIVARLKDITIVDDYAHHPTEIKATLKAAQNTSPKRVVAIFQPHRFTRTKLLYKDFGKAFVDADVIVLTEIYAAGEKPIEGVSAELIINEIKKTGKEVVFVPLLENVTSKLAELVAPGDLVITLGAGNVYQTGLELAERLK